MDTSPFPTPSVTPREIKCDRYYTKNNKTHLIYGGYEGIPENLMINVIVWLVLLLLFSILRKIAWDYGRIALVSRREERPLRKEDSPYNVWTSLFYGEHKGGVNPVGSQESLDTRIHSQDTGFCSWIVAFIKIKDEHILQKSGRDAVQYLSFQRYLMVYLLLVCVFSIAVILPVNFQGTLEGDHQAFGHTTISNISSDSPTLWVHAVLAVVFLIIAVYFMRHFSVNLHYEEDEQASRTLMLSHIPKERCSRNMMLQHFQEAYQECKVSDVQFAFNITRLVSLDRERQVAFEGRINSESIYRELGERPLMRPYRCGQCLCCCDACGCKQVDAVTYYTEEERILKEAVEGEKVNAYSNVLSIAFVTFDNEHMAGRVYTDFKTTCKGAHNPGMSNVSRELDVANWEVRYAPSPDNIYWENLSIDPLMWWIRAIVINGALVILLFFLTTPSLIMNLLDQIHYRKALEDMHSPFVVQFLPTTLLWAFSAVLPNIVYYSDLYIGHWTRTAQHHAVMRKTFIFLLLMVLILPSLGLTSAKALVEWFGNTNPSDTRFRWTCIFLPDNGAFFVNYVITSAFIGTAAELVRIPELLMYMLKLSMARSAAERTSVRKAILWEFQFGAQYAWMMCIFSVVVVYAIPCPLIVPFGLVYMGLKHLVDRYNIYFAYGPSRINKNIHASAINFVIVAVILLQVNIVFFSVLRSDQLQSLTVFSVLALFVTLIIFFGRMCFGWFKGLSPIHYKRFNNEADQGATTPPEQRKPFVPTVLLSEPVKAQNGEAAGTAPASSINSQQPPGGGVQSYGTVENDHQQTNLGYASSSVSLAQQPPGGAPNAPPPTAPSYQQFDHNNQFIPTDTNNAFDP